MERGVIVSFWLLFALVGCQPEKAREDSQTRLKPIHDKQTSEYDMALREGDIIAVSKDNDCFVHLQQAINPRPVGRPFGMGPALWYVPTYWLVEDSKGVRFEDPPQCMFADLANVFEIKVTGNSPHYIIEVNGGPESNGYEAKIYLDNHHYTKRTLTVIDNGLRRTCTTIVTGEANWDKGY